MGAQVLGDGNIEVSGISSIKSASAGDVVFVEDEKNLRLALESRASAVIAGNFAEEKKYPKPLLISKQPRLSFAYAAKALRRKPARQPGIHSTAVVHPSARLAEDVTVGARAVVEDAEIGAG